MALAPIITLLITVTISLLATRAGAVALKLTGLSSEIALFQARSAFTGVGFTTGEAESLVNHPVRRRILMLLMFWGNIGIAAVIASTIASFAIGNDATIAQWLIRLAILGVGIGLLWLVFTSKFIDDLVSRWVEFALIKFTNLDVHDFNSLLQLNNGFVVMELQVNELDWIDGKNLAAANLSSEGVLVLGLTRLSGTYVGSPNGRTEIRAGDILTVYGPADRLEELDIRKKGAQGDRAHRIAVKVQQEVEKDEKDVVDPQP